MDLKVAKLIPVFPYTAHRRHGAFTNGSDNYDKWSKVFTELVHSEIRNRSGCKIDVFLYYRTIAKDDTGRDLIYHFNNIETHDGKIHVIEMENDHVRGFSIIKNFLESDISKEYSHILYQEDDVAILDNTDGYVAESVVKLECNKCKVVAYSVAVESPFPHMGGLFALFPIEPLRRNLETFPMMPQGDELEINKWILNSLGAKFEDIGYLDNYKNTPINDMSARCFHQKYVLPYWRNEGKHLFKVGL